MEELRSSKNSNEQHTAEPRRRASKFSIRLGYWIFEVCHKSYYSSFCCPDMSKESSKKKETPESSTTAEYTVEQVKQVQR